MSDEKLIDSISCLWDMSDADMVRLAQLLLDQADTPRSTQREIAKLLGVPMLAAPSKVRS